MRGGFDTEVANDEGEAPEYEDGGGGYECGVEAGDMEWFNKRVCEVGRLEKDGGRVNSREDDEEGKGDR
ncbi:hypothetical protein ACSBR1_035827 [Camellia fascicularis]